MTSSFGLDKLKSIFSGIDWVIVFSVVPIVSFGLVTMFSFVDDNSFFIKQSIWFIFSLIIFIVVSNIDFKFLRRTTAVVWLYLIASFLLLMLFAIGSVFQGAQSWLNFGFFAFQPVEFAKLVLILTLAKYFSRRHVEIRNIRHILVSGIYAFIIFILVILQPDFGSSIIIFMIWFGMVFVSGISKKHLSLVFIVGAVSVGLLWTFVFQDYQKARIMTFLHPLQDIQGAGYNAFQSMVAVGSGQVLGKGIGYGTQSRLKFLPEYQTDFIFSAYAEEWGFIGVLILFCLYLTLIWRILTVSMRGATNFETLFGMGLAIWFMSHLLIHVGMNVGVMPVTGLTLPFMSYGGTSLLMSFVGIGILNSMGKYARAAHRDVQRNEFVGF